MKQRLLLLITACFVAASIWAAEPAFPRITPSAEAVQYAEVVKGGASYTWEDLARIALWASGASLDEKAKIGAAQVTYMEHIASLVDELGGRVKGLAAEEKAQSVLSFMFEKTLKRYSINQTQLDTLFKTGSYNCVSSAVFYAILAHSAGIAVEGVVTRDHAFVSVKIDGETVDIETTNKYGFAPGKKKEFADDFGKSTGFAYVPPGNYRNRAQVSEAELVSLILSNRIVALEAKRNYAAALPLAVDREALLAGRSNPSTSPLFGDPSAEKMDRVFNVAANLLNTRKEEELFQFIDYAESAFPAAERWAEVKYNALNNMVGKFLNARKTEDAKHALEKNAYRVKKADADKLMALINDEEARQFHNQFAALFNKKKYTDAAALLETALAAFPDNKQLNNDMKLVESLLN